MRNTVLTIATLCGLAACATDTVDEEAADRKRRDAGVQHVVDSGPTSSPDAAPTGGGSTGGGTVSCYTEGFPTNTCSLPTHCCFSNYSSQHNGACTSNSCAWGTIDCDGPEDCAAGQHCCSTQLQNSDGIAGYRLTCQASACGAAPAAEELCHPGGASCSNGGSCVTAYGRNNDLPRSLYICR
ncbi:MAG TPA: hypothetical protein VMZ53_06780 [Kofleriaceae bacterium]|nr:hypothetical protein [Kofleriaceae bacterium]